MTLDAGQAEPLQPTDTGQGGGGQPEQGGAPNPAPQSFQVDGQEYTVDQIREFAKAANDYKQFTPRFTQQQQLLKDPQKLLEYARSAFPDQFPSQPAPAPSPDDAGIAEAERILRERGFRTEAEVKQLIDAALAQREADRFIADERSTLEKEWDGQNGKPKFDFEAVRQYAVENGYPSLSSAFEIMNKDALREWYASQKINPPAAPTIAKPGAQGVPLNPEQGPSIGKMGAVKDDFLNFLGDK